MQKNGLLESVKIKINEDISTNAKTEKFAGRILEEVLKKHGYINIEKYGASADYVAEKKNEQFYFELKSSKKKNYFGSASFSEWGLAFEYPDNYFFIVALIDEQKHEVDFYKYTPKEFIKFCSIPPIKVFFNVGEDNGKQKTTDKSKQNRKKSALMLTKESFKALSEVYCNLKNPRKGEERIL